MFFHVTAAMLTTFLSFVLSLSHPTSPPRWRSVSLPSSFRISIFFRGVFSFVSLAQFSFLICFLFLFFLCWFKLTPITCSRELRIRGTSALLWTEEKLDGKGKRELLINIGRHIPIFVCLSIQVCMCLRTCMCVRVCVWKREREREREVKRSKWM